MLNYILSKWVVEFKAKHSQWMLDLILFKVFPLPEYKKPEEMKAYYKVQENIMYFACHRYQISEDTYSSNKKAAKNKFQF